MYACMYEMRPLDAKRVKFLFLFELVAHVPSIISPFAQPVRQDGKVTAKLGKTKVELIRLF